MSPPYRQGVVGHERKKNSHSASRVVGSSDEGSREDILELYSRLKKKSDERMKKDPVDYFEQTAEKPTIEGFLKNLRSDIEEDVVDALKMIGREAENSKVDLSDLINPIISILHTSYDDDLRYHVVRTIGKMRETSARDLLVSIVENDTSLKVRVAAVKALGLIRSEGSLEMLINLLGDIWNTDIAIRKAAAFSLSRLDPDSATDYLIESLINDPDSDVRKEAAEALSVILLKKNKADADQVARSVSSRIFDENELNSDVRIAVINVIMVSECADAIDDLMFVLVSDSSPRVRGQAAHALAHYFDPRIERALLESLDREEGGSKKRMALALAQYAMRNPLSMHDEVCEKLIRLQKEFPKYSYIWKEAVKALPAC